MTYQHTSAQWIEITPENLGVQRGLDGYYEATDTADGLVITAYHVRDIRHPDGTTTWQYYPSCEIVLQGVTREEFVNGAAGNGQIEGTAGRDVIRNDYVDAGGDAIAAAGNIILAGAGNDLINLTVDDSEVSCGDGRDFVIIRGGGNTVYGEAGNDYLIARHDGSVLDGGTGDDRLVADIRHGGDHILTGGEGADGFEFLFGATRHAAQTAITDFELGVDSLRVDGVAIDLSDLPDGMMVGTDEDGSIILSVGLNDTLTLRGITETDLTGLLAA